MFLKAIFFASEKTFFRVSVQNFTALRDIIPTKFLIVSLSANQNQVTFSCVLLRATSGARNPNLNIGFKRMRGSYIALQ